MNPYWKVERIQVRQLEDTLNDLHEAGWTIYTIIPTDTLIVVVAYRSTQK